MGREKVFVGIGSAWGPRKFCFFTRIMIPLGVDIMIIGLDVHTYYNNSYMLF